MYDHARDVTTAWHAVRLWVETTNKKKLPSLASQLPTAAPDSQPQKVGQLKSALLVLSEQYGIPLRQRRKKKRR